MFRKLSLGLSLGLIAAAAPLTAQTGIGVVGGFVSANVTSDPNPVGTTYSGKSGFAAGVSLTFGSATGLSVAPEALYVLKGTTVSGAVGATSYSGSVKASYVEVPLLFRVGLGSGSTRFYLTGGPAIAFEMTCKTVIPGIVAEKDCNDPADPTTGIKSTDYGVMFGAGVAMGKLTLSARYDLGLVNINKDVSTGAATVKNKAIFVMLGLALGK